MPELLGIPVGRRPLPHAVAHTAARKTRAPLLSSKHPTLPAPSWAPLFKYKCSFPGSTPREEEEESRAGLESRMHDSQLTGSFFSKRKSTVKISDVKEATLSFEAL